MANSVADLKDGGCAHGLATVLGSCTGYAVAQGQRASPQHIGRTLLAAAAQHPAY